MEKPPIENVPRQEGAIENKLISIFDEWVKVADNPENAQDLNNFLSERIPGVKVSYVYRNAGSWEKDPYFTKDVPDGSSARYFKVDAEGKNFLLPLISSIGVLRDGPFYSDFLKQCLDKDPSLVLIPVEDKNGRWEIPQRLIMKNGVADIGGNVVENRKDSKFPKEKVDLAKQVLFDLFDLGDELKRIKGNSRHIRKEGEERVAILRKDVEDMWGAIYGTLDSVGELDEVVASWGEDLGRKRDELQKLRGVVGGEPRQKETMPPQKLENADLGVDVSPVSTTDSEKKIATPNDHKLEDVGLNSDGEVFDIESKRRESFDLFVESQRLLDEVSRLEGRPVLSEGMEALERLFNEDTGEFKTEKDFEDYKVVLREMIGGYHNAISALEKNKIDENGRVVKSEVSQEGIVSEAHQPASGRDEIPNVFERSHDKAKTKGLVSVGEDLDHVTGSAGKENEELPITVQKGSLEDFKAKVRPLFDEWLNLKREAAHLEGVDAPRVSFEDEISDLGVDLWDQYELSLKLDIPKLKDKKKELEGRSLTKKLALKDTDLGESSGSISMAELTRGLPSGPEVVIDGGQALAQRENLPLSTSFEGLSDSDFVWDQDLVDQYSKLKKSTDLYNLEVFKITVTKCLVPFVADRFDVRAGGEKLATFLGRLVMAEGGLIPIADPDFEKKERKQFDNWEMKDGKKFVDFDIDGRDLLVICEKAVKIIDERIEEAKRRISQDSIGHVAGEQTQEPKPENRVEAQKEDFPLRVHFDKRSFYKFRDNKDKEYYANLSPEKFQYWDTIKDYVHILFVLPSLNDLGLQNKGQLHSGLTKLVGLHNKVELPIKVDGLEGLDDWPSFRRDRLDSIKVGEKTFADFEIRAFDLEEIFNNAKILLDRKIALAREVGRQEEGEEVVENTDLSEELPPFESLPPTPVSGESIGADGGGGVGTEIATSNSPEIPSWGYGEMADLAERLKSRKRTNPPSSAEGSRALATGTSGSKSETSLRSGDSVEKNRDNNSNPEREANLEGVERKFNRLFHKWFNRSVGGTILVSALAIAGVLYDRAKNRGEKNESDSLKPVDSMTNKTEQVEKVPEKNILRGQILELEKNLTNFVSPDYLRAVKSADRVVSSNAVPEFKGFEQIDSRLTDHLAFIWNEDNGFYPKGWTFGKLKNVNYSTNVPSAGEVEKYKDGQLNFYTNANFFATFPGNTNKSFVPVRALDEVFAHEIGHANDWRSQNWAYLGRGDVGLSEEEQKLKDDPDYRYEKRLILLAKVLERVDAKDRVKFDAVEKIDRGENELQAEEYWASLCEMYFNHPKKLKEHKEDWNLVNNFVQEMDPGFDPEVADTARFQVGRWFEDSKDGFVVLSKGGKTNLDDFRKEVREGLKGYGGKPRKFDAYTTIPKK
jgi:hypothetical protein